MRSFLDIVDKQMVSPRYESSSVQRDVIYERILFLTHYKCAGYEQRLVEDHRAVVVVDVVVVAVVVIVVVVVVVVVAAVVVAVVALTVVVVVVGSLPHHFQHKLLS